MVFDRDVRQRDALFDFGSLADVGQVQIVLCRNGLGKPKDGETKSKRRKRNCFHNCGVNPSQIFGTPLPDNWGFRCPGTFEVFPAETADESRRVAASRYGVML